MKTIGVFKHVEKYNLGSSCMFVQAANSTTPGGAIEIIIQIVQCTACATGHINPVPTENVGGRGRLLGRRG